MQHNSSSPSTNLFIGREVEVREIRALLADPACRLLTLVGPGGIGKTTLALRLAADMQALLPDGVAFVALQAVRAPDNVKELVTVLERCLRDDTK
jgi:predicted ATPase